MDVPLDGHVQGSFTGANSNRKGYFEISDKGTLFLDEIGDMNPDLQIKLLRVLEERSFLSVGSNYEKQVDVRVLAATNANLHSKISEGIFRKDLYFRLARFILNVAPLRERREDIPLLAEHFIRLYAYEMRIDPPPISQHALSTLREYSFPGNIRELKNIIEYALIVNGGTEIRNEHLNLSHIGEANNCNEVINDIYSWRGIPRTMDKGTSVSQDPNLSLKQAEALMIRGALAQTNGNIKETSIMLNIDPERIYRFLRDIKGKKLKKGDKSDEERIVEYLLRYGSINNAESRDLFNVQIHRASYLLKKLHKQGVIERFKGGRWARYALTLRG